MRRLPNDLPYVFRPPVGNSWVRPLGLLVNREIHLRRKYQIRKIRDEGFGVISDLVAGGNPVMLAPNHTKLK